MECFEGVILPRRAARAFRASRVTLDYVRNGSTDYGGLRNVSDTVRELRMQRIMRVPGIGRKTATLVYSLIFEPEAPPA